MVAEGDGVVGGTLEDGEAVRLLGKDGKSYEVPFSTISTAKLLLTDKLIAATAPLSTEGADSIQTIEE